MTVLIPPISSLGKDESWGGGGEFAPPPCKLSWIRGHTK